MISKFCYPLKLSYFPKETLWGGDKMSEKFGKNDFPSLGETWELTVRKNEQSIIKNGVLAGMSLGEYIDSYTDLSSESFPILIKFIDAADKLSVQVHPDDSCARQLGEKNGKTEMWYIINADENAHIIYGTSSDVSNEQLRSAILDGTLDKHLNRVNVSAGDVYFIPGGLVHAIGKGILLAEIQQNSDTTYRIYDYGRKDKNGKERELHIEQALKAFKCISAKEIDELRFSKPDDTFEDELLASCAHFSVKRHVISDRKAFKTGKADFISVLCIKGSGSIIWQGGQEPINAGDSFYIPKGIGSFDLSGNLELLSTTV